MKLFLCRQCMKTEYLIALYTVAAVVMVSIIKLVCWLTQQQNRNARPANNSRTPPAELLRPLILYCQYMLIVSSMPVDWPVTVAYPLKVLAWLWSPASPETLSIDCVLPRSSTLPTSMQKVLYYICMPVALLLVLVSIEAVLLRIQHARRQAVVVGMKDRLLASILVAIFFFLPSSLRNVFSMFACIPIDKPAAAPYMPAAVGSYWVFDMLQGVSPGLGSWARAAPGDYGVSWHTSGCATADIHQPGQAA
eukprot:GHUV01023859.1.p1 GENE.GHUV01023859.1~~GHUV01023859.1.p1  ORF type:complete len:250 (+),score=41.43 GHUV01023859.1:959-1708(+)